jgi:co-chaperonin GroES (HSP10)
MVNLAYKPEWAKYEKDLTNPDPEIARKAAEAFDEVRAEELKNNPEAREWEQSRKEAFLKDKPEFVKQRLAKEKSDYEKQLDKYLNGGIVMGKFIPSPGFMLVRPIKEEKTNGGVILPEGVQTGAVDSPNRGIVVAVGKDKIFTNGAIVEAPAQVGDLIMMRWHTMEMMYEGVKHNFISFEDCLGSIMPDEE